MRRMIRTFENENGISVKTSAALVLGNNYDSATKDPLGKQLDQTQLSFHRVRARVSDQPKYYNNVPWYIIRQHSVHTDGGLMTDVAL